MTYQPLTSAMYESEQDFRFLVDRIRGYALIQTDESGIVRAWNPGAERLFGYTSAEMVGQPAARLLTANDRNAKISEIEIQRAMQGEWWQDERWVIRKDGSQFWAHCIAEPVRDESGRLKGITKVLRDDTERRRAEETMRESLAEKEALLRDVHHRISNNLQLITSLVNLQSNEIEDRRVLDLLDQTRNRIFSIAAVHEILYRSRQYGTLDMAEYLAQLVPELVRFHDTSGQVQVRICGESGALELHRAAPFGLLLNELVSEACKRVLRADRKCEITVTVGREGDYNLLTLVHNGLGISSGDGYLQPGSLRLKLVQMLTQQLGGEVNVVSNADVQFHVRFPSSSIEGAAI